MRAAILRCLYEILTASKNKLDLNLENAVDIECPDFRGACGEHGVWYAKASLAGCYRVRHGYHSKMPH